MAIVGATTGKSAVVGSMENVTVQRSLAILRPNLDVVNGDYLNLLISSDIVQSQLKQITAKYAAQPGIYLNELSRLQTTLPPLQDQDLVVAHVKSLAEPLDASIERLTQEIELLREYRTRLVADVVAGSLDVRTVATRLPSDGLCDARESGADLDVDVSGVDDEAVA